MWYNWKLLRVAHFNQVCLELVLPPDGQSTESPALGGDAFGTDSSLAPSLPACEETIPAEDDGVSESSMPQEEVLWAVAKILSRSPGGCKLASKLVVELCQAVPPANAVLTHAS